MHPEDSTSTFVASAHLTSEPGSPRYAQRIRTGRHELVSDEPEPMGGKDAGAAPFGLVLSGLAACTSITLAMYAERKGWTLGPLRVDLRLFREGDQHRIERTIHFDPAVTPEQRASCAAIAEKTPVTRALRAGFAIATTIAAE